MVHHLNNNKQFMAFNGILAFAVIFVVVIFVYISLRFSRKEDAEAPQRFVESYTIVLQEGFGGIATSVYLNDSLLLNQVMPDTALALKVQRLDEQNALMIVDNATERISLFQLEEAGGLYKFKKNGAEVVQLP